MSLSLYNLAEQHRALAEYLADTNDDPAVIADTLESEAGAIEDKILSVAYVIKSIKAEVDALETAIDEMRARATAKEQKVKYLKDYLLNCMSMADIKKVKGVEFDVSVRANRSPVQIYDAGRIPAEFKYYTLPTELINKDAIYQAIKSGAVVEGAELVESKSVIIK